MNANPIRVLIVDDSAVVRGLLAKALETDPRITISGTAMHGERALHWMEEHEVDVVILDVEMPIMDGLTTLRRIQEDHASVRVIMASGLTYQGAETTIQALALGAAGCIAKPVAASMAESIDQLVEELVPLVKALGGTKKTSPAGRSKPVSAETTTARRAVETGTVPKIVVIGSSTGGPKALTEVLTGLPVDFPLPILIVQHMPPMFTPMLAKHIEQDTGRPCQEAVQGQPILPNHTYVAPGDYHMSIDKQGDRMVTTLDQAEPEHFCRPSVNPLFRTAAEWYGKSVLGVMLTGMGEDGIEGTRLLVERGGEMLAQDEATSVVWGMPAAVVRENLAHHVLPLPAIAGSILKTCQTRTATS